MSRPVAGDEDGLGREAYCDTDEVGQRARRTDGLRDAERDRSGSDRQHIALDGRRTRQRQSAAVHRPATAQTRDGVPGPFRGTGESRLGHGLVLTVV
ncbi:hypothetical protein L5G28_10335 [Gordonia sp. HY285]|uniref:hypothetical protein n=1 Tax=Gordonia liuliyuniae TaxID=2911517 RepID=UPI001F17020D|nr:hypothetical protein [Gordonia liuliyuniae]MCF8610548.1 hypothetical protein [Gordonia liuliyuniae]